MKLSGHMRYMLDLLALSAMIGNQYMECTPKQRGTMDALVRRGLATARPSGLYRYEITPEGWAAFDAWHSKP